MEFIHEENYVPLFMHLSLKYHLRKLRSGKKPSKPFTRAKVFFLVADRCITSKPVLPSKGPRLQLEGAATEAGFDGGGGGETVGRHLTSGTTDPSKTLRTFTRMKCSVE